MTRLKWGEKRDNILNPKCHFLTLRCLNNNFELTTGDLWRCTCFMCVTCVICAVFRSVFPLLLVAVVYIYLKWSKLPVPTWKPPVSKWISTHLFIYTCSLTQIVRISCFFKTTTTTKVIAAMVLSRTRTIMGLNIVLFNIPFNLFHQIRFLNWSAQMAKRHKKNK